MIKEKYKDLIEKEGNALDWNYRGFNCHIRRVNIEYFGYLCGYIEIPKIIYYLEKVMMKLNTIFLFIME